MRRLLDERDFPVDAGPLLRLRPLGRHDAAVARRRTIVVEDAATADLVRHRHRAVLRGRRDLEGARAEVRRRRRRRHRQLVGLAHGPRRPAGRQRGQPATRSPSVRKGIIANPNCTTMAAMPVLKAAARRGRPAPPRRQHLPGGVRQRPGRRRGARRARCAPAVEQDIAALVHDGVAVILPGAEEVRRARSRSTSSRSPARSSTTARFETDEEQKLRNESRKILGIPDLLVSRHLRARAGVHRPLAVDQRRVRPAALGRARARAARRRAGRRADRRADPAAGGRARTRRTSAASARTRASPDGRGLALFVSNDNLRKGAALNAVQIAELVAARLPQPTA